MKPLHFETLTGKVFLNFKKEAPVIIQTLKEMMWQDASTTIYVVKFIFATRQSAYQLEFKEESDRDKAFELIIRHLKL